MKFQVAYAEGSPSHTVTIDGTGHSLDEETSRTLVKRVRHEMSEDAAKTISKFAIVSTASDASFDLDFRFIQASNTDERLEMRGDCGHSMLTAVASAVEMGIIKKPPAGEKLRVKSLNTGALFLCETATESSEYLFHAHIVYSPARALKSFLPLETPQLELSHDGNPIEATIVTAGNPYVFISGSVFGLHSAKELFGSSKTLIQSLEKIRGQAQKLLKLPKESAFPKIALLACGEHGGLAARAVYQTAWHPSLALTGTIALAVARSIQETIPEKFIRKERKLPSAANIETAQGLLQAELLSSGNRLEDTAEAVVIKNKRVIVVPHAARQRLTLS